MLNSTERILSSFNRATTITLGDIALPVTARPVTQKILFSIIEDLGPYNTIVGRTWLHLMKAIPSTYHKKISYLTNAGQVNLLSSQLTARQCYQLFMQVQRGVNNYENPPPRRSYPYIAITDCRPDQDEREGLIGCGSLGNSSVGQAKEVHIR